MRRSKRCVSGQTQQNEPGSAVHEATKASKSVRYEWEFAGNVGLRAFEEAYPACFRDVQKWLPEQVAGPGIVWDETSTSARSVIPPANTQTQCPPHSHCEGETSFREPGFSSRSCAPDESIVDNSLRSAVEASLDSLSSAMKALELQGHLFVSPCFGPAAAAHRRQLAAAAVDAATNAKIAQLEADLAERSGRLEEVNCQLQKSLAEVDEKRWEAVKSKALLTESEAKAAQQELAMDDAVEKVAEDATTIVQKMDDLRRTTTLHTANMNLLVQKLATELDVLCFMGQTLSAWKAFAKEQTIKDLKRNEYRRSDRTNSQFRRFGAELARRGALVEMFSAWRAHCRKCIIQEFKRKESFRLEHNEVVQDVLARKLANRRTVVRVNSAWHRLVACKRRRGQLFETILKVVAKHCQFRFIHSWRLATISSTTANANARWLPHRKEERLVSRCIQCWTLAIRRAHRDKRIHGVADVGLQVTALSEGISVASWTGPLPVMRNAIVSAVADVRQTACQVALETEVGSDKPHEVAALSEEISVASCTGPRPLMTNAIVSVAADVCQAACQVALETEVESDRPHEVAALSEEISVASGPRPVMRNAIVSVAADVCQAACQVALGTEVWSDKPHEAEINGMASPSNGNVETGAPEPQSPNGIQDASASCSDGRWASKREVDTPGRGLEPNVRDRAEQLVRSDFWDSSELEGPQTPRSNPEGTSCDSGPPAPGSNPKDTSCDPCPPDPGSNPKNASCDSSPPVPDSNPKCTSCDSGPPAPGSNPKGTSCDWDGETYSEFEEQDGFEEDGDAE